MADNIFAENRTDEGGTTDSVVITIASRRDDLFALTLRGLGSASVVLERKDLWGEYVPVSSSVDFDTDGVYEVPSFPGEYRLAVTGTPDGLYAALETVVAARRAIGS